MTTGEACLRYFAYGANMAPWVFVERRGMAPTATRVAYLKDFRLVFDHPGLPVLEQAFANLQPSPGDGVWGVLYELAPEALEALDRLEGGGRAYDHLAVHVCDSAGDQWEAIAYISASRVEGLRPSRRYRDLVADGASAQGLPEDWCQRLARTPASATWVPRALAARVPEVAEALFRRGFPLRIFIRPYWAARAWLRRARPNSSAPASNAETAATAKGHAGRES